MTLRDRIRAARKNVQTAEEQFEMAQTDLYCYEEELAVMKDRLSRLLKRRRKSQDKRT